jgi:hypothetical protein
MAGASVFAFSSGRETYVDHVVEKAVLGNSNNSGSMVGACVDSRQSVLSRSEAARNVGTEDTVAGGFVQTLEERELGGVEDVWRFKVVHRLDDNTTGSDVHQGQFRIGLEGQRGCPTGNARSRFSDR